MNSWVFLLIENDDGNEYTIVLLIRKEYIFQSTNHTKQCLIHSIYVALVMYLSIINMDNLGQTHTCCETYSFSPCN
jgi:hypothetical protein